MAARPEHRHTGWLVAAVLACFAASVGVQYARERYIPPPPQDESMLYVESAGAMSKLALGYDALLADVYWIRAVQYFGGTKLAERARRQHDLLYPLLDITTTLDPLFNIAYRFGAIFLSEGYPAPPGRPDLAVKLLDKGFRNNPVKWEYLYDAGFVHYWWTRDYPAAAAMFEKASQVPGSPEWMPGLAAATLSRGGDRQGARFVWRQVFEHAEAEYMRENARRHLVQLDIMDELDVINSLMARVAAELGVPVLTWDPLVQRGMLRRSPPVDPSGTPYVIHPGTGRATLAPESPYYPLPEDVPSSSPGNG
jgi:hypothetical protein